MRRQAAHLTLALSEAFRDQGREVLCLIDSVTRFAMALREIGLSAGEPPASKGYTPLGLRRAAAAARAGRAGLRRAGRRSPAFSPCWSRATTTNEPVADAVRGIPRRPHRAGAPDCRTRALSPRSIFCAASRAPCRAATRRRRTPWSSAPRRLLSTYEDMAELIRIGAYRQGSDPAVDEAIRHYPAIEAVLKQDKGERADLAGRLRRPGRGAGCGLAGSRPTPGRPRPRHERRHRQPGPAAPLDPGRETPDARRPGASGAAAQQGYRRPRRGDRHRAGGRRALARWGRGLPGLCRRGPAAPRQAGREPARRRGRERGGARGGAKRLRGAQEVRDGPRRRGEGGRARNAPGANGWPRTTWASSCTAAARRGRGGPGAGPERSWRQKVSSPFRPLSPTVMSKL